MKQQTISVIIPVYNEVKTISSIVEVARTWVKAREVIVVNDGSKDKTKNALLPFSTNITIISYPKNRGKGYAVYKAINHSTSDILLFLDGDLIGLAHHNLDALVEPLLSGKAAMTLGVAHISAGPFNEITGERAVFRKAVVPYITKMKNVGYGVELLLNTIHKGKRVVPVHLPYVYILSKFEKHKRIPAVMSYMKEAMDLTTQFLRQYSNEISPNAARALGGILNYLRKMFEYLS
jgi:glycosyltransferase involved in cell wall biosynthesis